MFFLWLMLLCSSRSFECEKKKKKSAPKLRRVALNWWCLTTYDHARKFAGDLRALIAACTAKTNVNILTLYDVNSEQHLININ